jgi:hypothetical protein
MQHGEERGGFQILLSAFQIGSWLYGAAWRRLLHFTKLLKMATFYQK